ncbi:RHS repeat domain-containing protein [Streptomyces virginiae]|uniref:RHS repeat domain-containing protein n=1 Tax=Streptomyces virginiae TaxID=1961 RepID=UPI003680D04D
MHPPTPGKHDLPKVTQTGTAPHDETFTYDASGNTQTRKSGTGETQYLDWDAEGRLKSLVQGTTTDSFIYDMTGIRLLRKEKDATTLYLPGGNELKLDKTGTVTGTRYYDDVAVRTGGKLTFTFADHHNTSTTQVTADATQTVTRRKTGLFGETRGTQPTTWTGEKTFVGGTKDNDSGLTHIGAREYDPLIGRFISVDPIMDLKDSQQLHGYTYAANNPFTYSDPDGLKYFEGGNEDRGFQSSPQSVVQAATRHSKGYSVRPSGGCGIFCGGNQTRGGDYVKYPGNPAPKPKPVVYVQTASGYPARGVPQGSILDPNRDAAGSREGEYEYWFDTCMSSGDSETKCRMRASWYSSAPLVAAATGAFSMAALNRGGALGQSCTTCGSAEPNPLPLRVPRWHFPLLLQAFRMHVRCTAPFIDWEV